jgi:hypothetical protein
MNHVSQSTPGKNAAQYAIASSKQIPTPCKKNPTAYSAHPSSQDWQRMGLSPVAGVNAFQQALPKPPSKEEQSREALLARQRKYDADRRMKAKALRVNQPTNWCQPSGLFLQAKEIRKELAKASI